MRLGLYFKEFSKCQLNVSHSSVLKTKTFPHAGIQELSKKFPSFSLINCTNYCLHFCKTGIPWWYLELKCPLVLSLQLKATMKVSFGAWGHLLRESSAFPTCFFGWRTQVGPRQKMLNVHFATSPRRLCLLMPLG